MKRMNEITITIKQTTLEYIQDLLSNIYDEGLINQNTGEKTTDSALIEVMKDLNMDVDI